VGTGTDGSKEFNICTHTDALNEKGRNECDAVEGAK